MRLIDADALDYGMASTGEYVFKYVPKYQIDNAPTIDAVPVVRCKDCKWWEPNFKGCKANPCVEARKPQDFCSNGERKDNE